MTRTASSVMVRMAKTVGNEGWCTRSGVAHVKPMGSRTSYYTGESGNCGHQRSLDHIREYESTNIETMSKSIMLKHVNSVHGGNKDGIEFEMKITDVFKDDPLGRQCMEGIKIRETICDHSLNSKEEFRQPGELVAELPSRRQQHGQHGRQQQRQRQ